MSLMALAPSSSQRPPSSAEPPRSATFLHATNHGQQSSTGPLHPPHRHWTPGRHLACQLCTFVNQEWTPKPLKYGRIYGWISNDFGKETGPQDMLDGLQSSPKAMLVPWWLSNVYCNQSGGMGYLKVGHIQTSSPNLQGSTNTRAPSVAPLVLRTTSSGWRVARLWGPNAQLLY